MKKTNISKFVAVGLCICALTGCGASPDEKPDTPNPIVNSNTNEENANGSSENKGNDILDSANLIGSVLEFTDNGCSVSQAKEIEGGAGIKSEAAGLENKDNAVSVTYNPDKLPEAARQMFGKNLCMDDIREIAYYLEREHQNVEARTLKAGMYSIFTIIRESHMFSHGIKENFQLTGECEFCLWEGIQMIERMMEQLKGVVPKWVLNRLQEAKEVLECFLQKNSKYVLHLRMDKEKIPVLCAASREIPQLLREMLWDREQALSVILTSGTLKAGKGFARTLQMTGLEGRTDVQSYVAESPFAYEENCLLYLPKTLRKCKRGSREEAEMVAGQIHSLICSTYGHTLVLFTSYTLMGSVYQILRDGIPFPMVEVWRHSQEEILRFKTMENAVLFAAGSCWEGVDFPGDMVSSLIIVKLPFAVPDPISEAEKETYESLEDYIQAIIVPDMQKKLRQGFGRAIRTETDTCVVSILDFRAVKGGKYHEDVMCALPPCQMAEELREVQDFIRSRKGVEYYL